MSESLNDKLEAFLRANPNVWIDGKVLGEIAGGYGWRTRASNLRTERGMVIENRQRKMHQDGCASHFAAADLEETDIKCDCTRYTLSEYRFQPAPKPTAAERERELRNQNEWGLR